MPSTSRTPVRKALSIGIEYKGLSERFPQFGLNLPAAHGDAAMMSEILQDWYGYRPENITILTDAKGSSTLPTRANILAAMSELIRDARPGDHLVFYFSGHGSQNLAPPEHKEEIDGYDELIWPCDIKVESDFDHIDNYILDNDIKLTLIDPLPGGVRMTILMDCCSSGTAADLPFSLGATSTSSPMSPREFNFCRPTPTRPVAPARQRTMGFVDLDSNLNERERGPKRRVTLQTLDECPVEEVDLSISPLVTSWSACLDNQGTLESTIGSVFLRAIKESLKLNRYQTNGQMLNQIKSWLDQNIPWLELGEQPPKPELSSNLNISFVYHYPFAL